MSMRTIIEINHDNLYKLSDVRTWKYFIESFRGTNPDRDPDKEVFEAVTGHRVLAQRHHSEILNLKIE